MISLSKNDKTPFDGVLLTNEEYNEFKALEFKHKNNCKVIEAAKNELKNIRGQEFNHSKGNIERVLV